MLDNLSQMHLKLLQNKRFKKQQKQLVILIGNKIAIGNKIGKKITKFSKTLLQNNSETVGSEAEIPKERYMSPEKRTEKY